MYGYIYKIENLVNGKVYIGQTIQSPISKRWCAHIYDLNKGCHSNKHLQSAWNKYGEDNFMFAIIDVAEEKFELDNLECFWISAYGGYESNAIYNIKNGGAHGEQSKETKEKIRQKNLGNKNALGAVRTDEQKKKYSKSKVGEKNPMYGKPRPIELVERTAKSTRGRKHTDDEKARMSASQKGEKGYWYGKHGKDNPNSIPIQCVETGEIFESSVEANKWLGFSPNSGNIIQCLNGKKKTCGGYHWKRVNDDNWVMPEPNKSAGVPKQVRCVETQEIFTSLAEASRVYRCDASNIRRCCNGERETFRGLHWEWIENI